MAGNERYFVTVIAPTREALLDLRQHALDLFKPTARAAGEVFQVDGLLTLEEVGRLVAAGYQVLVRQDAESAALGRGAPAADGARQLARQTVSIQEWLKGMEEGE
jgi:hypothetical protein